MEVFTCRMMNIKFFLLLMILCIWMNPLTVKAYSLEEFDFSSINSIVEEDSIDFEQIVQLFLDGEYKQVALLCLDKIRCGLIGSLDENKKIIQQIFWLALFLAVYTAIVKAFSDKTLPIMGFYILYLSLILLLMRSFQVGYQLATSLINKFFSLLIVILPVFYLAVAYAGNQAAATSYYQISLLIMTGMEWLLITIVFPFIKIYTILNLLNELGEEKYFSQFLSLGKKSVQSSTKILLASVIGMQVIQGLILPQADAVKNRALIKAVSTIPGIGGITQTMSSVLLGSGVLIRNGIGVTAMVCLVLICLIPFAQLTVTSVIFQICAALISPISDKRVTNCITKVSDSFSMLLKVMSCCLCVFLIIIASVCAMTGNGV